jgi:hypothetical protein
MQKEIEKLSEQEVLKFYPLKDESLGWYFRTVEISNGAWEAEGSDLWGRKESAQGSDPEQLIKELASEVKVLNERIKNI